MSPLLIIFIILAIVVPVFLCIVYKNKIENLTTANGILTRRNETLEERFSQEEQATTAPALPQTGVEILQTFAQSHQVDLKTTDDYENEDWELYLFSYQSGNFHSYVGKHNDEMLIRYPHFDDMPYSEDALIRVLQLCDDYTSNRHYVKLTYTVEKIDIGKQEIHLHLCYEMIGVSQSGLEFLMNYNFAYAREVSGALNDIRKEVEKLHPAEPKKPKTEAEYQAEALQLFFNSRGEIEDVDASSSDEEPQYMSYDAHGKHNHK